MTARRSPFTPISEHFWSQVKVGGQDECWPWTRSSRNSMHGALSINNVKVYAHRFAFEDVNGAIPDGLVVRHSCDNGLCCNPAHLLVGLQADNMRDAADRGRSALGERNGRSKLRLEQVQEIRALLKSGLSQSAIARKFGVSRGAVKHIACGTTWPEGGDES